MSSQASNANANHDPSSALQPGGSQPFPSLDASLNWADFDDAVNGSELPTPEQDAATPVSPSTTSVADALEDSSLGNAPAPISSTPRNEQPAPAIADGEFPSTCSTPPPSSSGRRVAIDLDEYPLPSSSVSSTNQPSSRTNVTFASVLRGTQRNAPRFKQVLTRPSRDNLQKLLDLADDEQCDEFAQLQAIQSSTPFPPKPAKATLWIQTGTSLHDYSNEKIINAVFQENKDAPWAHLLLEFVQMNKARAGDLVVSVTSPSVRTALAGTMIQIFGQLYPVATTMPNNTNASSANPMDSLFYLDIVDIRYNFDTTKLFQLLRRLKTKPVFQAHRSAIPGIACRSNVWRVYFRNETIPDQLVINGHPTDQLCLDGIKYNVFVKNYQRSTQRAGYHSPHCLELDHFASMIGFDSTTTRPNTNDTPAPASKKARASMSSTRQVAVPDVPTTTTEEATAPLDAPTSQADEMDMDLTDNIEETSSITPAPTTAVPPATIDPAASNDGFVQPQRNKRRHSSREEPQLVSWASNNIFDTLRTVQAFVQPFDHTGPTPARFYIPEIKHLPKAGTYPGTAHIKKQGAMSDRLQWHPDNLTMDEIIRVIASSADEGAHFVNANPTDSNEATRPNNTIKIWNMTQTAKVDNLWKLLQKDPLNMNLTLTNMATRRDADFRTFVRLHTWHRWVSATRLPVINDFQRGYQALFKQKPTLEMLEQIVTSEGFVLPDTQHSHLSALDIEDALSAFEIWLAVQAPILFSQDAWIVYLTHRPTSWLPTQRSRRMLAPDTLWTLLRSEFGRYFTSQLIEFCPTSLNQVIHGLSHGEYQYPEHSALVFVDGSVTQLGFGQTLQC